MWKAKLCCLLTIFSIPGSYFFSFYITSLGELIHSHCLNVTHVVTDDSQIWTFSWDMFLVFENDTSLSGCSTGAWLPRWQNLTTHLPPITCLLSFVSLSWSKSETWFVILTHLSIINLKSYHFSLLSLISLGSHHFSPSLLPLALDHILSLMHYCKSLDQHPWFLTSQFQTTHCTWRIFIRPCWWPFSVSS